MKISDIDIIATNGELDPELTSQLEALLEVNDHEQHQELDCFDEFVKDLI